MFAIFLVINEAVINICVKVCMQTNFKMLWMNLYLFLISKSILSILHVSKATDAWSYSLVVEPLAMIIGEY
jgi:predicted membrane channel-forming protein YqfA (hemolysin III family)